MDNRFANQILSQCNGIEYVQERKYWLVRTDGGIHYDDFITNGYIAIGWDYISVDSFNKKNELEVKTIITNQERTAPTRDEYDEDKEISGRVTAIYNKLKRFIREFSIGDIVIIPSRNADRISIGLITSEVTEDPNYASNYIMKNPQTMLALCPYAKRRSVNWVKGINKENIDVYLVKAFSSHHAISDLGDYADYINRELYPIYTRDNWLHSIIRAGKPDGVTFGELKSLIDLLADTMDNVSNAVNIPCDINDVKIKLNINSPGIIEIISALNGAGVVVAIVMLAWNHVKNGGKLSINFKVKDELEFSAETESLGIEGRKNEAKQIEADREQKLLTLMNEQKLRELSQTMDMHIPQIDTNSAILNIESEDAVNNL